MNDDEWLTVQQAAWLVGKSTATMRRWAANAGPGFRSPRVTARKFGKAWQILASSLPKPKPAGRMCHWDSKRVLDLIESYRDYDNALWFDQVPYLTRTQVVSDLEGIL